MMACVASTSGLQPAIVPSSVANRNRLAPVAVPFVTANPLPPLNTMPVGAPPPVGSAGVGIDTTSGDPGGEIAPVESYKVETPVSLSATHQKACGLNAMPHGFTRFGSVTA